MDHEALAALLIDELSRFTRLIEPARIIPGNIGIPSHTPHATLHAAAKLAHDHQVASRKGLAVFYDEMPGNYEIRESGFAVYDGEPPVFQIAPSAHARRIR